MTCLHQVDLLDDRESPSDEGAWIARVRTGDAVAFEALVRAYATRLVAFAMSLGCDADQAEDLAQDVFTRIWECRTTWAPKTSIRSYLFGAVRNRACNAWRHARVRRRHMEATLRAVAADPSLVAAPDPHATDTSDVDAELNVALGMLTERQALAIRLRYEHGLRHADVAAALAISISATEQLLGRALRALRAGTAANRPEPVAPRSAPSTPPVEFGETGVLAPG